MAHLDKESLRIILTSEEEEMFKEANHNASNKKTPTADKLIKWINEGK